MTSVSSFSLSGLELAVTGSQATKTVACLHSSNATLYCVGSEEGKGGEEAGGVFPVGVTLVDNSSDIPVETLWHYGCSLFLVEVGILPPHKGTISQGILGIFYVTFGKDSERGEKRKTTVLTALSKLFSVTLNSHEKSCLDNHGVFSSIGLEHNSSTYV